MKGLMLGSLILVVACWLLLGFIFKFQNPEMAMTGPSFVALFFLFFGFVSLYGVSISKDRLVKAMNIVFTYLTFLAIPLGMIIRYYRPDASLGMPFGWVFASSFVIAIIDSILISETNPKLQEEAKE
ncbi:MAG: hypothetical protein V1819_00215 [bacterium]